MSFTPKFNQIRRSTAQNAYQLLDEVIIDIMEEPLRLDIGQWGMHPHALSARLAVKGIEPPACGIVGCIAGWIVFQHDRKMPSDPQATIPPRAAQLLGYDWTLTTAADQLFSGDGIKAPAGTLKHAKEVVARIRKFQRDNAAHLLAQKLPPRVVRRRAPKKGAEEHA